MPEILQETVRNVDGRVRETPQGAPHGDAGRRILHAGGESGENARFVLPDLRADHKGRIGVPRRAGEPHVVADAGARAGEALSGGHFPHGRDRKRHGGAIGRLDGVAAQERAAEAPGHFEEPRSEFRKPRVVAFGKGNGEEEGAGFGPGRREVGEIDGEGLSPHRAGRNVGQEMRAHRHHVGRHGQRAFGQANEGAVVAHALRRPAADRGGKGEVSSDQIEFALGHGS